MSEFFDVPGPEIDTVTLDRLKFGVRRVIDEDHLLLNADVEVIAGYTGRRLAVALKKDILAEKLPPASVTAHKRVEFSRTFPADWWQLWKNQHAPSWFRRRWPVRWTTETEVRDVEVTVDLQKYRTYPEATYALPKLGKPVKFHAVNVQARVR